MYRCGEIMEEVNYLAEWFIRFLKNRDIYFKKIKNIEQKEDLLIVEEKNRTVTYFLVAFTDDLKKLTKEMKPDQNYGLLLYNDDDNLDALLAAWSDLIKIRNLIVYFINPFSKLEKKWVVYPCTHDWISEKEALKTGLRAMFETVEPISKRSLMKIIKN
ncbi:hypothetical protein ACFL96_10740 [Thermoproteota archaeon]